MTTPEESQEIIGVETDSLAELQRSVQAVSDSYSALPGHYKAQDPSLIPKDDPQVALAWQQYEIWIDEHKPSDDDVPAYLAFQLVLTPLLVDAGFHDADYVDDVANDWMYQDLGWAEEEGLTDLALKIKLKIFELNKLLPTDRQSPQVQMALKLKDALTQAECAELVCSDNPYIVIETALKFLAEKGVEAPEAFLLDRGISTVKNPFKDGEYYSVAEHFNGGEPE